MRAKHPQAPVVVIDADPAIRDSLHRLFTTAGLLSLTYSSAKEFLADHARQSGCIVLDVRMPGMSGLELQRQLALRGSLTPVIFLTAHGDIAMAVEAIRNGAFDFLEKPFRDPQLLDRVQRALETGRINHARANQQNEIRSRWATLTSREREVFRLMAEGHSNKVMAARLALGQRTVEIHRARVMEKMRADSFAELVRMAAEIERADNNATEHRT